MLRFEMNFFADDLVCFATILVFSELTGQLADKPTRGQ